MEPFVRTDNTHGKPQWAAVPSFFSLLSLVSISIRNNLIMSRQFVVNYIPVTGQHFTAHILIFKIFGLKTKIMLILNCLWLFLVFQKQNWITIETLRLQSDHKSKIKPSDVRLSGRCNNQEITKRKVKITVSLEDTKSGN